MAPTGMITTSDSRNRIFSSGELSSAMRGCHAISAISPFIPQSERGRRAGRDDFRFCPPDVSPPVRHACVVGDCVARVDAKNMVAQMDFERAADHVDALF